MHHRHMTFPDMKKPASLPARLGAFLVQLGLIVALGYGVGAALAWVAHP